MSSKFNGEAVKSLGGEFIKKTFSELIKLTFPGRKLHSPTHLNAKVFFRPQIGTSSIFAVDCFLRFSKESVLESGRDFLIVYSNSSLVA